MLQEPPEHVADGSSRILLVIVRAGRPPGPEARLPWCHVVNPPLSTIGGKRAGRVVRLLGCLLEGPASIADLRARFGHVTTTRPSVAGAHGCQTRPILRRSCRLRRDASLCPLCWLNLRRGGG